MLGIYRSKIESKLIRVTLKTQNHFEYKNLDSNETNLIPPTVLAKDYDFCCDTDRFLQTVCILGLLKNNPLGKARCISAMKHPFSFKDNCSHLYHSPIFWENDDGMYVTYFGNPSGTFDAINVTKILSNRPAKVIEGDYKDSRWEFRIFDAEGNQIDSYPVKL